MDVCSDWTSIIQHFVVDYKRSHRLVNTHGVATAGYETAVESRAPYVAELT